MIRAAAKNYESVAVVVDPADYETVLAELDAYGEVQAATRFALAKKVFAHTARYDGMITNYLTSLDAEDKPQQFPAVFNRQWEKVQDLRYGENPHQQGAFYREVSVAPAFSPATNSFKAKNSLTTTSPTAMLRGSVCALLMCPLASSSSMQILAALP